MQGFEVKRKMAYVIVRWIGGGGTKYMDLETAVAELVGAEIDTVIEWLELLREAVDAELVEAKECDDEEEM